MQAVYETGADRSLNISVRCRPCLTILPNASAIKTCFMMRKRCFSVLTFLFAIGLCCRSFNGSAQTPNIIIIFMDDMGYGDPEVYGGFPQKTPNINRLANEGMRFTQFYVPQPVCSASRAALLTGCYPNRVGVHGAFMPWSPIALNPEEETIAEVLKKKGYATGMVGKWHLGQKQPFLPLQQGFDEYFGLPYSNDMWPVHFDGKPITDTANSRKRFPPLPLIDGNKTIKILSTLEEQGTLTRSYTEKAVGFIRKNSKKPFFLYLAHSMPHVPIAASAAFNGKSGNGLFVDVMMEIDWSVGEVMKAVAEQKIEKNTIIMFLSDNGPWLIYGNHAGSSGGLREGKGTVWEGGVRVPFIIRWPGQIEAGTICNKMAASLDLLPTIAALVNASLPEKKIDGVDIQSLFRARPGAEPRDELAYYYDVNNLKAIRKGPYKLVFPAMSQTYKKTQMGADGFPGKSATDPVKSALYDLRTDPGETLDIKEQHPDIVQKLMAIADKYRSMLGDDLTNKKGSEIRPAARVE
jgi:arylsulfatase A-like enzyme